MADISLDELKLNGDELYAEEVYTDRRIGTIRRLVPVDANGERDTDRPIVYVGQGQIMTPLGSIPLSFELEASGLAEAIEQYPQAMKQAVEQAMEEMKELRRQAASSIVVPETGAGLGAGPGTPGGSKLKLP